MHGVKFRKPYITVDATSRIPAGIRLFPIVHTYGNYILSAPLDIGSQIVTERDISIRTHTEGMTIDENFRIHIYTVKINIQALAFIRFVNSKRFAIPTDTTG